MKQIQKFEKINHGDIQFYIDKMNEGDIDARNKIISHYSNQILKIISKYYDDEKYSKEDLFQVGFIGLLKVLNYNSNNETKIISVYIINYIKKEIDRFVSSENKYSNYKYTDTLQNENIDINQYILDNENMDLIINVIHNLPQRSQEIIYLYFYKELTSEQIALKYDVSAARINQILNDSIIYIKKRLKIKKALELDINLTIEKSKIKNKKIV